MPSWPGRNHSLENKGLAEGCFCPDGHILFNSYTDVCVPTCRKHRPGLGLWPHKGDTSLAWACPASLSDHPLPPPSSNPSAWSPAKPPPRHPEFRGLLFPAGRQRPWLGRRGRGEGQA